jgi:hypothetical protein
MDGALLEHAETVEERVNLIPMQEATKRGTYKKKISD